jgi:PAS domain S-box-containing protein
MNWKQAGQRAWRGCRTIRFRLAFLVVACVLPIWLVGGYLLRDSYMTRLTLTERHLQDTARALKAVVERELANISSALDVLATSPALESNDFARFRSQVLQILKKYPGADIILADSTGQQLVNSRLEDGRPLPMRNDPETVRKIFETAKPYVSDLFKGSITGRYLIGVDVPVLRDGRVVYDLAMTVPAERFSSILQEQKIPDEAVAVILDRKRYFIARNNNPEGSVGQLLRPLKYISLQQSKDGTEGIAEGTNIEGVPIEIGFSRSAEYGWSVAVNMPTSLLMAGLWQWIWWFSLISMAVLLTGFWWAFLVGRIIVRDVQHLSNGAKIISGGNLDGRLAVGGVTELIELSQSFNDMTAALANAQASQRVYQKDLELQVEARTAQLRDSEERYRSFFEASLDAVMLTSPNGSIQAANKAAQKMFGMTEEEICLSGQDGLVDPTDSQLPELSETRAKSGRVQGEIRYRNKNGAIFIGETTSGSFVDSHGQIRNVLIIRDITDRKRAEEALIAAKTLAEAATIAKSEFLANMSHEIRTPLNGVVGMLQLLERTSLDKDQGEFLRSATRSSKRLTQLLSDILDLSRIEVGQMAISDRPFELAQLKLAIMDLFLPVAKAKGLEFDFTIDQAMPNKLMGDDSRLLQILFNLAGNAVKFTPTGRVLVQAAPIRFPGQAGLRVLFSVSDTGIGISDEQLGNIFEPFIQGESTFTKRFQGAGLGLSIVRKLVGLMGGEMSIDSQEGAGTTFYITLPFGLPGQVQASDEPSHQAGDTHPEPRLRVLVVEDDETSAMVVMRSLEILGHTLKIARDGEEAIRKLAQDDFGLILMDVQLPVMNGVEATEAIRSSVSLGAKANIPIIAMTAYAMNGDKEKFLAAGMNDYIAKPLDMAELQKVMQRVVPGLKGNDPT